MNKILFSAIALTAFFTACEKDEHGAVSDTLAPEIELFSPDQNRSYTIGDTIQIKGRMRDNKDLHEASVIVCNEHGNMLDCPMHVHKEKEHFFDTSYVVKYSDIHHGITLKIIAEDHSHNRNEKVVDLSIK